MKYENYDPCFPDQPVVDLYLPLWAKLPAFCSKPAFVWVEEGEPTKGSILTYAQLNFSVQIASTQLLLQLQRGDSVVILCPPGLQLLEVIFGCQRAGLLIIPMIPPDPSFAKENYHHLVRVLSQTKPKAAITTPDYISRVREYVSSSSNNRKLAEMLQKLMWISTDDVKCNLQVDSSKEETLAYKYNGRKADELYLIQYTSGSTGIPKPVLVTAGAAAHNVRVARRCYDLHPNSVIVSWLPQYHDCGLMFLLLTIVSGATCVLTSPSQFVKRPRIWLEMITNYKATCTPVPSFTLPLVLKRGGGLGKGSSSPISLGSLRNLIIINEPIYKNSVEEFVNVFKPLGLNPSCISPSYGLAENCTYVSTAWRSYDDTPIHDIPSHNRLLPSARLSPTQNGEDYDEDMEIVVVNEDTNEPVADGIEGEIWVSSPSNGSGYLGHPYLTGETFKARLGGKGSTSSRCYIRTGDRGIVKGEERFLFVTGRCADVLLINLEKGSRDEETAIIHSHYIETAAYDSCPAYLRGGCLAAFKISRTIVVVAEMQRTEKDARVLRVICENIKKGVLKDVNIEVGLVVLVKTGEVPKTTSGKVQRWAAKDKLAGGQMSVVMEMRFGNNNNDESLGLLLAPRELFSHSTKTTACGSSFLSLL